MNKTVSVLLSSYNGERYIREMIDSILAQENVSVKLIVRDDGSSDSTKDILKEYKDRITVDFAPNAGVGSSFMNLVYMASDETDYYAFSDQDDIWLPDKLSRAVTYLEGHTEPALYASNQTLVDADCNKIKDRHSVVPDHSIYQIVCNNKLSGCTMVWNKELQQLLIRESSRPTKGLLVKRIHDVWVGAVAAATGSIYFDMESGILYRQHENNVVGVRKTKKLDLWKKKLNNPALRNGRSQLAQELYNAYKDEINDPDVIEFLKMCALYREDRTYRKKLLKSTALTAYTGESPLEFKAKVHANLF